MFKLGVPELLIILVLVLVIFGPSKLPGLGSAVGKTIKDFKSSVKDKDEKKNKNKETEAVEEIVLVEAVAEAPEKEENN